MRPERKIEVAEGAALGALSYALGLVQVPFPLVPYLIFDLGEIPAPAAMWPAPPLPSAPAPLVSSAVPTLIGVFARMRPAMRLAAVASPLGALTPFSRRGPPSGARLAAAFLLAAAARAAVMTVLNYALLQFLFPGLLGVAVDAASRYLRLALSPLELVLLLTAAFNAAQAAITLFPASAAARALRAAGLP